MNLLKETWRLIKRGINISTPLWSFILISYLFSISSDAFAVGNILLGSFSLIGLLLILFLVIGKYA